VPWPQLGVVTLTGVDLVLIVIFFFFSGVWGAIKVVDERTDNKFVFFVPAILLSLFIFSGAGEGYLFYACLFAFGPIIVMLLFVGFQQGTVPWRDSQGSRVMARSNYPSRRRRPLNLHRKLAPGYIRSYDRLIDYLQVRGGEIQSREDALHRLEEHGIENRFLSSPYVIKVLGFQEEDGDGVARGKEELGDDWWESGYDLSGGNGGDMGTVRKMSSTISSSSSPAVDSCGHPSCDANVSAFDFRCYTCRNRFCSKHAGSGIDCKKCSK